MTLEKINRRDFFDPDLNKVQENVIQSAQMNTEAHIKQYCADVRSFCGRYVCSDLFKETFNVYSESKDNRNRYNAVVHNSSAVLASEQLRRVLNDPDVNARTVQLFTGIPGAGKTSIVLQNFENGEFPQSFRAIYEGQLANPVTALKKISQVVDSGNVPVIVVVHTTPEVALKNTLRRFYELGRGASISVMSDIQAGLPKSLQAVYDKYGDTIQLHIVDNRDCTHPTNLVGWGNFPILYLEGHKNEIKRRLYAELEYQQKIGELSIAAYRQANGYRAIRVESMVEQRHRAHQENGDRQELPSENRAFAFINSLPDDATAKYPELAEAFATIDNVKKQSIANGLNQQDQISAIAQAQENIVSDIQKGFRPITPPGTGEVF